MYHTSLAVFVYCLRLLDVLADRKAKRGLSGHVLINGRRQPRNFKCGSAYVVQVCKCILYMCMYVSVCTLQQKVFKNKL